MAIPPAVLITGASSGIGEACARMLDGLGYQVFAGVRRAEDADRLLSVGSDRLCPVRLDVTDAAAIEGALAVVTDAIGERGLAGLVNNAGVAMGGPLEYLTAEELRTQFEVNVVGLHAVTRAFLPLVRRGRGRIVHIGSISGRIASPFTGPYAASKHAVEALADALRVELAPDGIHVAVVEPGQVRTPIWDKGRAAFAVVADRIPEEGMVRYGSRLRVLEWMVERAPRVASPPEAVADAVIHALESAEPRTRYVVGRDARVRLALSRWLPDRMMDALVLRVMRRVEARLS
ncbi:MAG TPA: SDR family oxidoreductase [Gemmatimonadales bacterium]|nr:SDR family oxidoreductase [Gemmatimonadales bacterium]